MIRLEVTATEARTALRRFRAALEDLDDRPAALAATELASAARSTASSRPTPQARLASTGLRVSGSELTVSAPSGVDAGVGFVRGSIFGGDWPSLAPPRADGYWLIPDAYGPDVEWLRPITDAVTDAVRRLDREA